MKEVDIYSNIEDAVKMVVANKVDLVSSSLEWPSAWVVEVAIAVTVQ